MSDWKKKLQKKAYVKPQTKKLESYTQPSSSSPAADETRPISPSELGRQVHMNDLTNWKYNFTAPRLTSDRLRISHELLFARMCRMRKAEILEDLLRVCLSTLPPKVSIKYVKSYKKFYEKLEEHIRQQNAGT